MAGAFERKRLADLAGIRPHIGAGAFEPAAGVPELGFGPMTPETMAGLPSGAISLPGPSGLETALEYGSMPAKMWVEQAGNAGGAWSDVTDDPSLSNITNAGVQTGLALASPTLTGASAAGGFGLAALDDFGLFDFVDEAQARSKKKAPGESTPDLPGLTPEQMTMYRQAKAEGRLGAVKRLEEVSNAYVAKLNEGKAAAIAEQEAQRQRDYADAVTTAVGSRDRLLARDRSFADTEVGKVYDKLGGLAPVAAGLLFGSAARLAKGPAKSMGSAAARLVGGAGTGVTAIHAPLAYDSFMTDVPNPEKAAYSEYAYQLPDGHPDKAKATERAAAAAELNPRRVKAQEELYDPTKLAERLMFGSIEGASGAKLGEVLPGALSASGRAALATPGNLAETVGSLPRRFMRGFKGKTSARNASKVTPEVSDDAAKAAAKAEPKVEPKVEPKPEPAAAAAAQPDSPPPDLSKTKARTRFWDNAIRRAEKAQNKAAAIDAIRDMQPGAGFDPRRAGVAKRRIIKRIEQSTGNTGRDWSKDVEALREELKGKGLYAAGAVVVSVGAQSGDKQ